MIRILWITNLLLPEAYKLLTGGERKGSGGWLESSASELAASNEHTLYIATASPLVRNMVSLQGEEITYYVFPFLNNYKSQGYEPFMKELRDMVSPDVVHVHGTEFPYGLAYMNVASPNNVVVSMQGVISVIAEHYIDGLSKWQIFKNFTLRDLRLKTLFGEQKEYRERGRVEVETIRAAKYIIGRTSFDKKFVMSVNPECKYCHCNESLRESFYHKRWSYDFCKSHSIFLSQSNYPVKGLHQFLKVVPELRKQFPDITVRIAGEDITRHHTMSDYRKYSGYGSIIYHLIRKLKIEDCVCFTGLLSEAEMVKEYLHANVFVCPSTCENSSNSIAEAQMLGVPCIASARGGNPDMITEMQYGMLFNFDDLENLKKIICEAFDKSVSYDGTKCVEMAMNRHNKRENLACMTAIYNTVSGK